MGFIADKVITDPIPDLTSYTVTGTLLDSEVPPNAIPLSQISTVTLTILDAKTLQVVNAVDATDILNTGRGIVATTGGKITVKLEPADNAMISTSFVEEIHYWIIRWTFGATGEKSGTYVVQAPIVRVPTKVAP